MRLEGNNQAGSANNNAENLYDLNLRAEANNIDERVEESLTVTPVSLPICILPTVLISFGAC